MEIKFNLNKNSTNIGYIMLALARQVAECATLSSTDTKNKQFYNDVIKNCKKIGSCVEAGKDITINLSNFTDNNLQDLELRFLVGALTYGLTLQTEKS